ncbi:hypothetical protein ACFLYH_02295 [Candidatus Dependentiae bacterium]
MNILKKILLTLLLVGISINVDLSAGKRVVKASESTIDDVVDIDVEIIDDVVEKDLPKSLKRQRDDEQDGERSSKKQRVGNLEVRDLADCFLLVVKKDDDNFKAFALDKKQYESVSVIPALGSLHFTDPMFNIETAESKDKFFTPESLGLGINFDEKIWNIEDNKILYYSNNDEILSDPHNLVKLIIDKTKVPMDIAKKIANKVCDFANKNKLFSLSTVGMFCVVLAGRTLPFFGSGDNIREGLILFSILPQGGLMVSAGKFAYNKINKFIQKTENKSDEESSKQEKEKENCDF